MSVENDISTVGEFSHGQFQTGYKKASGFYFDSKGKAVTNTELKQQIEKSIETIFVCKECKNKVSAEDFMSL